MAEPIHCRIIAFLLLIHYVTPWPWPLILWPWLLTFDLERLQRIACDVMKLCTKLDRNGSIRGGVIFNFSVWPNDLEHVLGVALGSGIIFTKFDLRQVIRAWIIAFICWYVMSSCDLDLWHVDLESLWYIKFHVIKVCTKFERNRAIPDWIIDNFANFCTRYVTPWSCPLTSWPWTFTALRLSYV